MACDCLRSAWDNLRVGYKRGWGRGIKLSIWVLIYDRRSPRAGGASSQEEALPMDMFLEILRAVASIASIARLILELWENYKHKSDDVDR